MRYLGDYAEDATLDFMWNSSDASGASITRATNGTISVYKDNNTTQTVAGVTDTEDFDTLTGIHHVRIVLTDAFYVTATDYMVVLSAATIDGETVNAVLVHFSIENRTAWGTTDKENIRHRLGTDGTKTAPTSTSLPSLPAVTQQGTAQAGSASTITLQSGASADDGTYNGQIVQILDGTGAEQSRLILSYVGITRIATVFSDWADNPDSTSKYQIVAGGERDWTNLERQQIRHRIGIDGGKSVPTVSSFPSLPGVLEFGPAQAGTSTSITLFTGTSTTDDTYNGLTIQILEGTGAGQARRITDYVGSTRVATIDPAWVTNPNTSSNYQIIPALVDATGGAADWTSGEREQIRHRIGIDGTKTAPAAASIPSLPAALEQGLAQAGTSTTITLRSGASALDDFYNDLTVQILDGTGADQARLITDYVGSTRVATVDTAWITDPDSTSDYQLIPGLSAGDGAADWTDTEKENIRFQIGINGTQTAPTSNTPNLSTQASVDTVDTVVDTILVDTADIQPRVVAIEIDTNEMQGKLPTNFIMGSGVVTDKDDDIDAILADTIEMQGKLPTNNIMGSSVKTDKDDEIDAIKVSTDALDDIRQLQGTINDAGPTTTDFDGDAGLSATDDFFNGLQLVFTSGALAGVGRRVSDYTGATKNIVLENALPATPADGDAFSFVSIETQVAPANADITSILTDTNEIQSKLPANFIMGSSVTTDKDDEIDSILVDTADMQPRVVNIETDTNEIQGKLPTNFIMGSAVITDKDDDIDAILIDTAEMQGKLPTNNIMGSSVKTDKDDEIDAILVDTADMQPRVVNIEVDTNEIQGKLPTNFIMGSSVTTDKDDEIDSILVDTADIQPRVVNIETDTNEIQGKLPANFIMGSSAATDKDDEIDAIKVQTDKLGNLIQITGNVNDATPAAGNFDADAGQSATDDFLNGMLLIFTSGTLSGLARTIADYDGTTKNIILDTAFPVAPANTDTFSILADGSGSSADITAILADTNEMQGKLPTNNIMGSSVKTNKDDEIDAILVDTSDMQPRVAAIEIDTNEIQGKLPDNNFMGSGVTTNKDDEIDAILVDTSDMQPTIATNLDTTVSSRATPAQVNTEVDNALDTAVPVSPTADSINERIKQIDENPNTYKADVSSLATQASVDTIDGIVDTILVDTNETQTKLPTNNMMGSSVKTDKDDEIDSILVDTADIQPKIDVTLSTRSSHSADDVWTSATRTLTSFGTLIVDIWHHLLTAITTPLTIGRLLKDNVDATISSRSDFDETTDPVEILDTGGAAGTSASELVDDTWREPIADHDGIAGSTAEALQAADATADVSAIADAVWDEILSAHQTSGTGGEFLTLVKKALINRLEHEGTTITLYDDDSVTPLLTTTVENREGVPIDSTNFDSSTPADRAKLT